MAARDALDEPRERAKSLSSNRVFVVIPVLNRVAYTRACLAGLDMQTYAAVTVIVVDHGSSDGTAECIRNEFPRAMLVTGSADLWWTGATNLGICAALGSAGPCDYVLTLNNDTLVGENYVASLVRLARDAYPAIVGSVAVDARDGQTIVGGGRCINWLTAKGRFERSGRNLQECLDTGLMTTTPDALSGRGTLFPVECFRRMGLLDADRLPHYKADYEFTIRAARAGWRLLTSYEAPVLSHVEATGVGTRYGRLPSHVFFRMFFSRWSTANLIDVWQFAWSTAPRRFLVPFLVCSTVRTVGGAVRDQCLGPGRG